VHPAAQCFGFFRPDFVRAFDFAVESAAAQRVADVERPARVEVAYGFLQDEPRRALVDPYARERRDVYEPHRHRGVYPVVEFLDAVVHFGRQKRVAARGEACGQFRERGARRDFGFAAEVVADYADGVGHG